jgi:hypothetical protein
MFHARKAVLPAVEVRPRTAEPTLRLAPASSATSDFQAVRHVNGADDHVLHDRAIKWLATLPADLRTIATARQYPRIVNRIADLWGHCEYTRLHFQSLLLDRRGGREGFPPEVRTELEALQHHYFEHLSGLPALLWDAVPLHPRRIPDSVFPLHAHKTEIDILPLSRDYAEPEQVSTAPIPDGERAQTGLRRFQSLWRHSSGRG